MLLFNPIIVGKGGFHPDLFAPEAEAEIIKVAASEMIQGTGATLYTMDGGYLSFFKEFNQTVDDDNHVTFARFFKVCIHSIVL